MSDLPTGTETVVDTKILRRVIRAAAEVVAHERTTANLDHPPVADMMRDLRQRGLICPADGTEFATLVITHDYGGVEEIGIPDVDAWRKFQEIKDHHTRT